MLRVISAVVNSLVCGSAFPGGRKNAKGDTIARVDAPTTRAIYIDAVDSDSDNSSPRIILRGEDNCTKPGGTDGQKQACAWNDATGEARTFAVAWVDGTFEDAQRIAAEAVAFYARDYAAVGHTEALAALSDESRPLVSDVLIPTFGAKQPQRVGSFEALRAETETKARKTIETAGKQIRAAVKTAPGLSDADREALAVLLAKMDGSAAIAS